MNRCIIAGSFGKKTNLRDKFDVDTTVFFNPLPKTDPIDFLPAVDHMTVLKDFLVTHRRIGDAQVRKWGVLVFKYKDMEFDVTPAVNLVFDNSVDVPVTQRHNVFGLLSRMNLDPVHERADREVIKKWCPSLQETVVEFVKGHSSFCKKAIRLVKFLVKHCWVFPKEKGKSFYSGSLFVEMVVIYVFEQVANRRMVCTVYMSRNQVIRSLICFVHI